MKIEISDYKRSPKEGVKVASFVLTFPDFYGLTIRDMSYFKKGENKWISFPQKPYESNGEKKYFNFMNFRSPSDFKLLQTEVLEWIASHQKEEDPAKIVKACEDAPF